MADQKERQALIANGFLADTRLLARTLKPARLRGLTGPAPGHHSPGAWPGQPGPFPREPGAISEASGSRRAATGSSLGPPLTIAEVAGLIGCSPWTVRQTLIPRGLPHFRFKANGRLIFYRDQVIRWIEKVQGGQQ